MPQLLPFFWFLSAVMVVCWGFIVVCSNLHFFLLSWEGKNESNEESFEWLV